MTLQRFCANAEAAFEVTISTVNEDHIQAS